MAEKIDAGAPAAPQNRKQIMDEAGNFVPVPDIPQDKPEPTPDSSPEFKVGDDVVLRGKVLEKQSTQGGQVSVKVQGKFGAAWFQGGHLEHEAPEPRAQGKALSEPPENK